MKANEAPEKIYLHPDIGGREFVRPWLKRRANQESVEYTRTDVFIEKAVKWIKEAITNNQKCNRIISKKGVITMGELIEDFKKYMKGE